MMPLAGRGGGGGLPITQGNNFELHTYSTLICRRDNYMYIHALIPDYVRACTIIHTCMYYTGIHLL